MGLALLAEIIGTVSGFGSSILFVPLATLFFDFQTVLGITAMFHVFSNLSKLALFRKGIDRELGIYLGVPAVLFVIVGAILSNQIPTRILEGFMNIVLLTIAIILIRYPDKPLPPHRANLVGGGILSGFIAGLLGSGGAIRGLTLSSFNLSSEVFVATSALIDLGVDSSRAVVYTLQGYFRYEHLIYLPFLLGISALGTWSGKLILKRMSQQLFRYMVLGTIIGTSIWQLYRLLGKT